jgi:hypothetical protein
MIHFVDLPSLSSLKAEMHSGLTETLRRRHDCQWMVVEVLRRRRSGLVLSAHMKLNIGEEAHTRRKPTWELATSSSDH